MTIEYNRYTKRLFTDAEDFKSKLQLTIVVDLESFKCDQHQLRDSDFFLKVGKELVETISNSLICR